MEEIKNDLKDSNWSFESHKIGEQESIIIPFVHSAAEEAPFIRKIVKGRATVKAVTVGKLNFIMIAE